MNDIVFCNFVLNKLLYSIYFVFNKISFIKVLLFVIANCGCNGECFYRLVVLQFF